ncbi:hypothetical protein QBC43DRAFT_372410 [Cladorrhinum sp. PSN259]|nr:hypothetical protein QBC43DRAFT_372410 [Cladorrhinum sp. PSN259]
MDSSIPPGFQHSKVCLDCSKVYMLVDGWSDEHFGCRGPFSSTSHDDWEIIDDLRAHSSQDLPPTMTQFQAVVTEKILPGLAKINAGLDRINAGLFKINAGLDRINVTLDNMNATLDNMNATLARTEATLRDKTSTTPIRLWEKPTRSETAEDASAIWSYGGYFDRQRMLNTDLASGSGEALNPREPATSPTITEHSANPPVVPRHDRPGPEYPILGAARDVL